MFVVHASWLGPATSRLGGLAVWGEDSSAPLTSTRRPGRAPRVQPHPYAASHADLVALLPPVGGKAAPETATLTLPTRGGGPIASPELVRDEITEVQGDLRAGLWQVPTLELEADLALDLLRGLDNEGGTCGASVVHLVELAGFAADLVARGRLLPIVLADPPRAVWRPVLTGPDAAWTRVLAPSMPPPLAAANPEQELAVWADALDSLVDAAARAALGPTPAEPRPRRHPGHRAWLAALTGPSARFAADRGRGRRRLASALGRLAGDAVAGPVRACFRLVEPDEDREDWHVRFALQATDEPSLVVDAEPSGVPRRRCPRWPGTSTPRRRPSWPSWARPAGSTRSWTTRCAPRARRPATRHRRRPPLPEHRAPDAGHGRVRRAAARLVDQAVVPARRAADRLDAAPARAGGRRATATFGLDVDRRVPLRPGRRRRGAHRRRAGRADRAEGAAGPAARPVGRAGRRAGWRPA